jgi:hypothetical protein
MLQFNVVRLWVRHFHPSLIFVDNPKKIYYGAPTIKGPLQLGNMFNSSSGGSSDKLTSLPYYFSEKLYSPVINAFKWGMFYLKLVVNFIK